MSASAKPLAVTGASAGIGYELAKQCIDGGFDLVIAADQPEILQAASEFRSLGANVTEVESDLATIEGVNELIDAVAGRQVDALCSPMPVTGSAKVFLTFRDKKDGCIKVVMKR